MSEFIFHNVGQGLFYSGRLLGGEYNFVYDCGTINKRDYLRDAIDKYLTEKEIKFVVISHLHKDHINGIEYLISKCNVNKFYLPYLGNNNNLIQFLIAVAFLPSGDETVAPNKYEDRNEYLLRNYKFFSKLYGIEEGTTETDYSEILSTSYPVEFVGEDGNFIDNRDSSWGSYFHYTKILPIEDEAVANFWKFAMFNRRQPNSVLNQLNNDIGAELTKLGYSNITKLVNENKIDDITKIYKSVFKNGNSDILNLTSTILVHYPIEKSNLEIKSLNLQLPNESIKQNLIPKTILAGDARFDTRMSKTLNSILIGEQNISTIFQVPHHGSRYNWYILPKNYKTGFDYYVIPFGFGNNYRHPSALVINDLFAANKAKYTALVTQLSDFHYSIHTVS